MNKKALIVIDANGQYDKENGCHRTMGSANVSQDFYDVLLDEIKTGDYEEIIYNINLPNCTTKAEIDRALEVDPILSKLDDETRKNIKIFKSGYQIAKEFDDHYEEIMLENSLAEQSYDFVVAGLYYDWCVKAHAENLQSRYPDARIQRPEYLSRWSSERAKYDRNKELRIEQIGKKTKGRFGKDTYDIMQDLSPFTFGNIRGVEKND